MARLEEVQPALREGVIKVKQDQTNQSITINGGEICYHKKAIITAKDSTLHLPKASRMEVKGSYVYSADDFKKVAVELNIVVYRNDLNDT